MAKLIVSLPDGAGTELLLTGEVVAGRDPSNPLRLDDTKASRRHCRFYLAGGIWMLEDLGSSNGTLVNGMLAKRKRLVHGDRIQVGTSVIVYDAPDDKPEAAPIASKSAAPVLKKHAAPSRRGVASRPVRRGR